jgi:hypothetical protein
MNDFIGQPLEVGDTIAWSYPECADLTKGVITKLGEKMVMVERQTGYPRVIKRYPEQVIRIDTHA